MKRTGTVLPPLINYNSKRELRAFLDERGLGMRKKFGQNFLIDPAARLKLLEALELQSGDNVWEIGPGLGAMTSGLLERGGRVCAFEIDPAFAAVLRESFGDYSAFNLVEGDVLKTWSKVKAVAGELFLFGNLPYNIAAVLLADFIEKGRFFKRVVVTVQQEVALRMAAKPGSREYSSFSVLCSSVYMVNLLSNIKSTSFYPVPRVDSRGVRLNLIPCRRIKPGLFYPLVRALFSSRRKTIRNTLSAFAASVIMGRDIPGKDIANEVLNRSGISGNLRPETLGIDEFAALAAFLEEIVTRE
ncbi:MAG: 16S rRNA (adenine(1518)-N(6)/adenine(1519)-N(6))-dimethyltransferase RsmA [Treponema sp.]|jgi:16S rRNA (adenine1518-N6/adenine1519-N6)-dimethyltransferase|nr:16S rRNA (adenine(1518)-N(6)/adenine(1519)-N(6))-dimethyltransferase RsmA [Treponema sp.]